MNKRKNFLEDISKEKPESYQEEIFVPAKKSFRPFITAGITVLLAGIAFFLFIQSGKVTVPDMSDWQLEEVQAWVSKEHENTVINGIYTMDTAKDRVLSQDILPGSKISKRDVLTITYSQGADPEEVIPLPDIKNMKVSELQAWMDENQMTGVTVKYEASGVVPKGEVISYELVDGSAEVFLRKNRMVIYVSGGNEDLDATFKMPDFYGKTKADLLQWEMDNQMTVVIHEEFNEDIEYGKVFQQNIKKDTKITRKDSVEVSISRGAAVQVPDFAGMTRTEASELAALHGMSVFFKLEVSGAEIDTVIGQDIEAGTKIDQKQILTLRVAENSDAVILPDFAGMSRSEAEVLAKNLNLNLSFREIESTKVPNQTVLSQNVKANKKVDTGASVLLSVAVNSGIPAENMWKLSLNDAQAWAKQRGITMNVIDSYSSDYSAGKIFDQDIDPGDYIPSGRILTIYHSLGQVLVENFIGKAKSEMMKWRDEVNQKGADIKLSFLEVTDTTQAKGVITDQSILEELVDTDQVIKVWVSATDRGVRIKNFEGLTVEDLKLWCDTNAIPYIVKECYSDIYKEGTLYGQNYAGTYLPKGEYLRINVSLGKVFVQDFTGKTKSEIIEWQREVNKKGANIELVFTSRYSNTIEKGRLLDQSVKDQEVELESQIVVTVSAGTGD